MIPPTRRHHPRRSAMPGHARAVLPVALVVLALVTAACGRVVELGAGDPVEFVRQPETSAILAADGSVLAELHGDEDRENVRLEAVADVLVQAVIATEDRRFFLHRGIDAPAILRAAVANLEEGEIEQGGSTITQQYVKNTMTGPARTLGRKLKEAALAYQLEQRYEKEEILERYLNTVYFGKGAYGVAAAAERYFGVSPDRLELDQAALLAGLIASPSSYDPYEHPDAAVDRRRVVLSAMVSTGAVTAVAAERAAEAPLRLVPAATDERVTAPYAVDEVKRLLQHDPDGQFAVLGRDVDERSDRLFTGGLRIHTTIEPDLQQQAEQAVRRVVPEDGPSAALVATDPVTGAIRALVGGRDYYDTADPSARFNLATQGPGRQPGSSFKPIALAAALSRGVSLDEEFPGGDCVTFEEIPGWEPCNYGGASYGPLTLREATVHSVNTVYARLAVQLGPTAILELARTVGFGRLPTSPGPSLALGAGEVTPLEMAGAYGMFPTLGRYAPPYLVERIETADGRVLWEHDERAYDVLDEAAAYLVNQTLQDVVRRGTGVRARIDRPQAGKTGTSQRNADAWFVGYTPELVAATWVGFPEGQLPMVPPRTPVVVEGGRWPAEIWREFAVSVLDGVPPEPFPVPEVDLTQVRVDVTRNCLPNPYTPPEVIEVRDYLRGTAPTERCDEPTGPPVDDVPGVTGLPRQVAERLLSDRGFLVDVRQIASDLYPPGIVERQRPDPGGATRPADGNAVVLWVAANPRTRSTVPDVTDLPADEAVALLEDAGWVAVLERSCPDAGAPPDLVWDQEPAAGTTVRDHSVVTIAAAPPDDGCSG